MKRIFYILRNSREYFSLVFAVWVSILYFIFREYAILGYFSIPIIYVLFPIEFFIRKYVLKKEIEFCVSHKNKFIATLDILYTLIFLFILLYIVAYSQILMLFSYTLLFD